MTEDKVVTKRSDKVKEKYLKDCMKFGSVPDGDLKKIASKLAKITMSIELHGTPVHVAAALANMDMTKDEMAMVVPMYCKHMAASQRSTPKDISFQ